MKASDLERLMKRLFPLLMVVAACGPGVYTRAEVVYAEPAEHVYVVPADRVIVVTREVLVQRGYVVYRVENRGPNRIVWARRGDDEGVRIFVTPERARVVVRSIREVPHRGKNKGWGPPHRAEDGVTDIDGRLRAPQCRSNSRCP